MAFAVMPSPGDIRIATRTTSGTLVTVPAGRVFCYDLNATNTITVAGNATVTVTVNGAAGEPSNGTVILQCICQGLALTASTNTAYITGVIRAGANDLTIDVTVGAGASSTTIAGYLL